MTTENQLGIEEGRDAAIAAFSAGMSGQGAPPSNAASSPQPTETTPEPSPVPATPEPAPEPAPAEPPSSTPSPETPSEPSPTPAPAPEGGGEPGTPEPPPSLAPEDLSPEAQRYLEMKGGDRNKALADALNYSNRLAALYREHPELFKDGAPGDPNAQHPDGEPPQDSSQPAAVPEVTPPEEIVLGDDVVQEVTKAANAWTRSDAECTNLVQAWTANQDTIQANANKIAELEGNIAYWTRLSQDPNFADDDLRRGEYQANVRDARMELGILKQETFLLRNHNAGLDEAFRNRRRQAWDFFANQQRERLYEESYNASIESQEQADTQREFETMSRDWPAAITRVATTHKIPADQIPFFKEDARLAAEAFLSDPNRSFKTIAELDAFLTPIAKRAMARVDQAHRARSAEYGAAATARATTPAPPSGPGTAPAPATDEMTTEKGLDEAKKAWKAAVS